MSVSFPALCLLLLPTWCNITVYSITPLISYSLEHHMFGIMMTKCRLTKLQLCNMLSHHKHWEIYYVGDLEDTKPLSHNEKKKVFPETPLAGSWKPTRCLCFWNGKSISYLFHSIHFSLHTIVPTLPPPSSLVTTQEKRLLSDMKVQQ